MLTKNQPLLIMLLVVVIFYQGATAITFTSKETVGTLTYRSDMSVGQGENSSPDTSNQNGLDSLCCEAGGTKCTSCGVVMDGSTAVNAIFCSSGFVLIPESGGYKKISYTTLKAFVKLR